MNGKGKNHENEGFHGRRKGKDEVSFGRKGKGKNGACSSFSSCNDNRNSELKRGEISEDCPKDRILSKDFKTLVQICDEKKYEDKK